MANARWNFTLEALSVVEGSEKEVSQNFESVTHLITQPRGAVLPEIRGMMQAHRSGIVVSDLRKAASVNSGTVISLL